MEIDAIRNKLLPIFKKNATEKAILFGSHARSTQNRKSDIDLIIIDDEDLPYMQRLGKYFNDISLELNMPVDLFVYSKEEFEKMKEGFFIGRAVEEGVVLYERWEKPTRFTSLAK